MAYSDLINRSDCLFYFLEENELIYPERQIEKIVKLYPVFQDIKHDLKKIYKENFNNMVSTRFQNIISKFSSRTKKLILKPTPLHIEKAKELLLAIQHRLDLNLIKALPKEPIFLNNSNVCIVLY